MQEEVTERALTGADGPDPEPARRSQRKIAFGFAADTAAPEQEKKPEKLLEPMQRVMSRMLSTRNANAAAALADRIANGEPIACGGERAGVEVWPLPEMDLAGVHHVNCF